MASEREIDNFVMTLQKNAEYLEWDNKTKWIFNKIGDIFALRDELLYKYCNSLLQNVQKPTQEEINKRILDAFSEKNITIIHGELGVDKKLIIKFFNKNYVVEMVLNFLRDDFNEILVPEPEEDEIKIYTCNGDILFKGKFRYIFGPA